MEQNKTIAETLRFSQVKRTHVDYKITVLCIDIVISALSMLHLWHLASELSIKKNDSFE